MVVRSLIWPYRIFFRNKDSMNSFYNSVQDFIRKIRAIDLKQADASAQILLELKQFTGIRHFKVTFRKGSCIYRCRPNEEIDFFGLVDDLKYPPAKRILDFGRCNLPQQPVFYASEFEWNSFIELMHALDKRVPDNMNAPVTVGEWVLQQDLEMVVVLNPDNKGTMARYMSLFQSDFDEVINREPAEEIEGLRLFFHFIAEAYARSAVDDQDVYKLTSAYSDIVFGMDRVDGIIYPSVQYHHHGINYALKPSVLDNKKITLSAVAKFTYLKGRQENGKASFTQLPPGGRLALSIDQASGIITW